VTSKRKRRRSRARGSARSAGSAPAGGAPAVEPSPETTAATEAETEGTKDTGKRGPGGDAARRGFGSVPSPYPPFAESIGAGFRAAGSSAPVLAVAFVGELMIWGLFQALGAPTPAGALAGLMGLPPVHLVFEVPVARSLASGSAQVGLLLAVVAIRALILGLLCLMLVDVLRRGTADVGGGLRRLPRVWASMAQFYVIEVAMVLAAPLILGLLGPQFIGIGTILVMIVGLQFLILAPAAIAAEDAPASEAIRWSLRAARLPGLRHFGLVLTYFFLTFSVLIPASGFGLQPATPSILVWAFALVVTFLHTGVLGAFVYRWLAVRDEPSVRRPRTGGTAPAKAGAATAGSRAKSKGTPRRRR
jgi:hypothetical protein